ncbi:hypothetical protein LLH00_19325 [bacterium]|nr:hypothetical protein [bacterium]
MRGAFKGLVLAAGMALLAGGSSVLHADSMLGAAHLGIPVSGADARGRALGGATTALNGEDFSFSNPARLVNFWRSGVNGTFSQDYITLKTPQGSTNLRATEYLSLNTVFPAYKKFVVSWGLYQDRDLAWKVSDSKAYDFLSSGSATRTFSTTGSFYVSRIGVARTVSKYLAVGVAADWLIGVADHERRIAFDNSLLVNDIDQFKYHYSCVRPTFGLLGAYKDLNVGLSYTLSKSAHVSKEVKTNGGVSLKESLEQDLASSWRLGGTYRVLPRLLVCADYERQSWAGIAVMSDSWVQSVDQSRWGLGVELQPSSAESPHLYRRLPWRVGYSRTVYPFELGGNAVHESIFAFGTGMYMSKNAALLDLAFEIGKRSVEGSGYPEESVMRFVVSVSAFERWVSRPKRK